MRVIKIYNIKINFKLIALVVDILKSGGVVVIPTETAYGLAGDATSEKAVKKIYKIKGRSFKKFLPLIASSIGQMKNYFKINKQEMNLLKKYRGLSVVLEIKNHESRINNIYALPKQKDCAVRVSTNDIARQLARKLGRPITATSANRSGGDNCYRVEDILEQIKDNKFKPDLILDAGKLKKRKPSTIVKVEGERMEILRQGEIRVSCQSKI